jgi:hypothetical protein
MYKIIRFYQNEKKPVLIKTGLTEEQAKAHCNDPETSSLTATNQDAVNHTKKYGAWFDAWESEK